MLNLKARLEDFLPNVLRQTEVVVRGATAELAAGRGIVAPTVGLDDWFLNISPSIDTRDPEDAIRLQHAENVRQKRFPVFSDDRLQTPPSTTMSKKPSL